MRAAEAALAVIGLLVVIAFVIAMFRASPSRPIEADLAAPYREGLHAAIRLQRTAQDLEQQIYSEAEAVQSRYDAEGTAATGESE